MAYISPVIKSVEMNPDGSERINLVYVGDAGEPPVPDTVTVNFSVIPDQDYLRRIAIEKVTSLNATRTFKGLFAPGMIIDTETPLPVKPIDTAFIDWQNKHHLYEAAQRAVAFGYEQQDVLDEAKAAALKAYKHTYLTAMRTI